MVTLFLMFMSFTYNLLRIGTLVLCIHDQVDYLLAVSLIDLFRIPDLILKLHIFVSFCTSYFPYDEKANFEEK